MSNDFGAVTSLVANVTVPGISFVAQPTNTTTMMNTNVTLSATVAGTAPLAYRWQKNGRDLSDTNRVSGSGTPSLAIANVEPGDTGSYRLIVTNTYTAVTSDVAVLTVLFPQPLLNVDFGAAWYLQNRPGSGRTNGLGLLEWLRRRHSRDYEHPVRRRLAYARERGGQQCALLVLEQFGRPDDA